TGNGKTVYCTTAITVTVVPDAPVCTLTASPSTINEGGSSTLKWTTENATSVTINQGVGSVSLNGSRAVSPQSSTTYTLTATGNGKTVNCYATVTVEKNPELPVCTLTASPTTIIRGSAATLTWTTKNATSVRIDQGIGPVSANDTRSVMPTQTTTYTLTATGNGKTVYCDTIITVIPPQEPESPVCTLTASPTQITRGGSAVLAWTTRNATSVTINQGIGQVNVNDSRTVAPQSSTTYTLTATGNGKTVYCTTAITVTVVPDAPVCTLTASPTTIIRGSAATLTWTTDHATYVVIDNHIGPVKLDDSRSVMPTQTTTYKLTATGNGKSVDCYATIVVEQPTQKVPVCEYLTASKSSIKKGESLELSWSTRNATRVEIYPTVGVVGASDTRTVSPTSDTTYKLTAYGTGGQKDDCFATVVIEEKHDAEAMCWLTINPDRIDEGDRATIEWGGTNIRAGRITNGVGDVGASGTKSIRPDEGRYTYVGTFPREDGKGNVTCSDTLRVDDDRPHRDRDRDPKADLSFLPFPDDEPLAFVYLSDMPYTGLDLGPLGTALYWTMLVLWSGAAAYLVVFNAVPMALRRMQGTEAHGHETQAVVSHAPHQNHQVASVVAPAPARTNVARSYSSYEGFRSFAKDNGALTIDDIVSGLSREEAPAPHQAAPAPAAVAYAAPLIAPTYAPAVEAPKAAAPAVEQSDDIPGFIGALLAGDKDGAFGAIRTVTRSGGDSEEFLTQAVCALDEAYRAKLDGTECHPEIARLTKDCAPSFLERLVGSLTTAVDGTYSAGVTGVKLAVTRALSIVNG
ncbi:MAG TPA: hypothetical protein VHO23_02500, partial [Candidatus Paceibacterota bacterium]|nr:hypothetical protein [Candidatus Paceibacterota bacterium]